MSDGQDPPKCSQVFADPAEAELRAQECADYYGKPFYVCSLGGLGGKFAAFGKEQYEAMVPWKANFLVKKNPRRRKPAGN